MKNKIVSVGIRLTRNCNMACQYCNISYFKKEELSFDSWKKVLDIIKRLGANKIIILGGEPTLYLQIEQLISYIVNDLKIKCSLTTNAYKNYEKVISILDAGLNKLGVSVDTLDLNNSISPLKCKNGIELINNIVNNYKKKKITIVNYTVLNSKNAIHILDLIEYMNKRGVHTYILPFHWGNEGTFEHRKNNKEFAFVNRKDMQLYKKTVNSIINLKKNGYLIDNSIEFLETSIEHIKLLDWKCEGLSELRIDSDGRLVCCCDKIGSVNDKYSIFDLEKKKNEFFKSREIDRKSCKGCLWPSSFEAELEKNRQNNLDSILDRKIE